MDKFVFVAATGARNTMLAMSHNANNLANANTVGFKADIDHFVSRAAYGPGAPTRVFSQSETQGFDNSGGTLIQTGNALDIAIDGEGWFAVQLPDGSEAMSRRGDLNIDSAGLLRNGAGHLMTGDDGPIAVPPHQEVHFGDDGTVNVRPAGAALTELVTIGRLRLVNPPPDTLEKGEDGLFRMKAGEEPDVDGKVQIKGGALESSNVNVVRSMVNMIEYARNFELQVKLFEEAKKLDDSTARLLSS